MATFTERVKRESYVFPSAEVMEAKFKDKDIPIFVDESYYSIFDELERVTAANLKHYATWRDCHYYGLYKDPRTGKMAWLLTGGRYD